MSHNMYTGGNEMRQTVCENIMVQEGQFGQIVCLILFPPVYNNIIMILFFKIMSRFIHTDRSTHFFCLFFNYSFVL